MIANCGCDERGLYSGGAAGDQSGREWWVCNWYDYPWDCVFHHPNKEIRKKLAELATAAAKNDHMGYDQSQRLTFWYNLQDVGYDPSKIKVNCEADCSSGVAAIVKAVGFLLNDERMKGISISSTTRNLKAQLAAMGFEVRNGQKYLKSDDYASAGDIWLNEGLHTTINVTDGKYADKTEPDDYYLLKVRTLQNGMKGSDVYLLKCLLAARKFLRVEGAIGGTFGDGTVAAVARFQKKMGLEPDSIVGINTWNALLNLEDLGKSGKYFKYALKQIEKNTDRSDSINVAKSMLKIKGYYNGGIDGKFKDRMKGCVEAFQRDNKLVVDGICGQKTWAKLIAYK